MSDQDSTLEVDESAGTDSATLAPLKGGKKKNKPPLRAKVIVFDNWCKGCGLCVEFCPQDVLEMNGGGKVRVAAPERCVACHWCDTHCPDFAIVVREIDEVLEEA